MSFQATRHLVKLFAFTAGILAAPTTAPAANGIYSVVNGRITDPSGAVFVARGINMYHTQLSCCLSTAASLFPKANFVRLAVQNTLTKDANGNVIYVPLSQLSTYVQQITSAGVVVVIEDHVDYDEVKGAVYTGAALTAELNWYSSLAKAFRTNPRVWFGTMNEPDIDYEIKPSKYTYADIINQQKAIYNAIRKAGNTAPVLMEVRGGWFAIPTVDYKPTFATMSNIVWDLHYYGWITNLNTDQTVVNNALGGTTDPYGGINVIQTVRSKDGLVPVIIGEYAPGTKHGTCDANGNQVVFAVQQAATQYGHGNAAWAYNSGISLVNNATRTRTNYGNQVNNWLNTGVSSVIAPSCP